MKIVVQRVTVVKTRQSRNRAQARASMLLNTNLTIVKVTAKKNLEWIIESAEKGSTLKVISSDRRK